MRNQKALKVMLGSLAVLSGNTKQVKQIFRGFTGRVGTFDRRTQRYRNELERITAQWIDENEGIDPAELTLAIAVLVSRLQNAAERNLKRAYKLGLGNRTFDEDDLENINAALASNLFFLQNSLAPDIERRIDQGLDLDAGFAAALADSAAFTENRSGLYAGSFWTLVWAGLGAAMLRKFGTQALRETPVRRLLDPGAKHCPTCPPKAGVYSSWEEMLALTGGLPADGSDICMSNCRCSIQVLDGGNFVYEI